MKIKLVFREQNNLPQENHLCPSAYPYRTLQQEYGTDRFTVEPAGRPGFTSGIPDADRVLSWGLTFGDKMGLRQQLGDGRNIGRSL